MEENSQNHVDLPTYKVILLGDSSVGKTCLCARYLTGEYGEQKPTIGIGFNDTNITKEGEPARLELWDTAGQEKFRSFAPMYYRGAHAALICYDITNPTSLRGARQWIEELRQSASSKIITTLVGTKSDLEDNRKVSKHDAKIYAEQQNLLYAQCSAKEGSGIAELFQDLIQALPDISEAKTRKKKKGVELNSKNKSRWGYCSCG